MVIKFCGQRRSSWIASAFFYYLWSIIFQFSVCWVCLRPFMGHDGSGVLEKWLWLFALLSLTLSFTHVRDDGGGHDSFEWKLSVACLSLSPPRTSEINCSLTHTNRHYNWKILRSKTYDLHCLICSCRSSIKI